MRVRAVLVVAVLALALVFAATAAATVTRVRLTSPISAGSYATLTVRVSRVATCSITVYYKSGPSSAAGLYPKRGKTISWTWKVGTRTTGFFDFLHGQTGVAPNGIELHPVLRFMNATCQS